MKRILGLAAGAMAATFLIVGPAFAVDNTTSPTTSTEKPGKLAVPHRVTGSVVNVDENAHTFTVKDSKGKEYVLTADPAMGSQLSDVKAGGRVKVSYKKTSSGQMVATQITPADSTGTRTNR